MLERAGRETPTSFTATDQSNSVHSKIYACEQPELCANTMHRAPCRVLPHGRLLTSLTEGAGLHKAETEHTA